MPTKVSCPLCFTALSGNPGQELSCQVCGHSFTAHDEAAPEASQPQAPGVENINPVAPLETPARPAPAEKPARKKNPVQTAAPFAPPPGDVPRSTPVPAPRRERPAPVQTAAPYSPPPAMVRKRKSGVGPLLMVALLLMAGSAAGVFYFLNNNQPDDNLQAKGNTTNGKTDTSTTTEKTDTGAVPKKTDTSKSPVENDPPKEKTQSGPTPEPMQVAPMPQPMNPEPMPEPIKPNPSPMPPEKKEPTNPTLDPDLPTLPTKKPDPQKPDPKKPDPKEDQYRTTLSKENQEKVNKAIEKGVEFLKGKQLGNGTWHDGGYSLGYAALPGLTLLECGVPPNNLLVQKAAMHVREHPGILSGSDTYQLALAVLFLDKLGDPRDHDMIRFLAMRLVGGQRTDGGWRYWCPDLKLPEAHELFIYLHQTRPIPFVLTEQGNFVPLAIIAKEMEKNVTPVPLPKNNGENPPTGGKPDEKPGSGILLPFPEGGKGVPKITNPLEPIKKGDQGDPQLSRPAEPFFRPFNINVLSDTVKGFDIVKTMPTAKLLGRKKELPRADSDNSCTQFAMMALWVARKYGVPVEKTMALVDQRFISSQNGNGGWGYGYIDQTSVNMTPVGLIGLAVGHGSHKEALGQAWKLTGGKGFQEDPNINLGLTALGKHIGVAPAKWDKPAEAANLYFTWTVERVAVLYNLKTIGGKDWYSWAAHMLVTNQHDGGHWWIGGWHGASDILDTSLALLILKRANFVPDLTDSLKQYIPIRDPGGKDYVPISDPGAKVEPKSEIGAK